jgi:hypothetical protein
MAREEALYEEEVVETVFFLNKNLIFLIFYVHDYSNEKKSLLCVLNL